MSALTDDHWRILEVFVANNSEYCYPYRVFIADTGMDYDKVKSLIQELKQMEYIKFHRGLMTEEGEVAGSGFGLNQAKYSEVMDGFEAFDKRRVLASLAEKELNAGPVPPVPPEPEAPELDEILVNLYLGANTTEKQPNWQAQMNNPELAEAKAAMLAWHLREVARARVDAIEETWTYIHPSEPSWKRVADLLESSEAALHRGMKGEK